MCQFLAQETDTKHQFLGPETDITCQFLVLAPETDIMGEWNYIARAVFLGISILRKMVNPIWARLYIEG